MGCFSYLCKVCNDPIVFDDDDNMGEHCTLYLLENGTIIEQMTGQYNHYGCVFSDYPFSYAKWESYDWDSIVDLNFCNNKKSGIVAVHTDCHPNDHLPPKIIIIPRTFFQAMADRHPDFYALLETQSPDDPDQGSGDIKHTTEGKYSQSLIEKLKTKTPVLSRENSGAMANLDLWEKINDGMEELEILMDELREKLDNETIK